MDKYAKAFVRASLIYLGAGVVLGVLMVTWIDLRFPAMVWVHSHLLLLGFMAMMIYGVGYHILPRFMGRPVYSQRLGNIQAWVANITLLGLAFSSIMEVVHSPFWRVLSILFGIGQGVSIFLFIINLWKSMIAPAPNKA